MTAPTFLLGTGAQKAGTTWLHDYLAASPACVSGYRKEYHVLDVLDVASEDWMRERILIRARREVRRAIEGATEIEATALHRASMLYEPELYPDYFTGLLARDPSYRLTMDLTPGYAMLGAERLRWVRERFAARGVRAVAVFVMRDPVERIWSQLRMVASRQPERFPRSGEEHLRELYAHPTYAARTRYDETLTALDQAFAPTDVHIGFYETLFTPTSVQAICALVGIEAHPPDFDVRSNSSPRPSRALSPDTVRMVATHYREVYDAVAARFPDVDLTEHWPSARLVL